VVRFKDRFPNRNPQRFGVGISAQRLNLCKVTGKVSLDDRRP